MLRLRAADDDDYYYYDDHNDVSGIVKMLLFLLFQTRSAFCA